LSQHHSYKEAVKEETLLCFDLKALNPKIIKPNALTFSNNNRTVTCYPNHNWASVKTTKQICNGVLYAWRVVLDRFSADGNAYKAFIGLENDNFPYYDQNVSCDIIGSRRDTGHSFGLGMFQHYVKGVPVFRGRPDITLVDGDVIQCVVDTRKPYSIQSAKFSVHKIQEQPNPSAIELTTMDDIDLKFDGPYYPAVSLVQDRKLTLLSCSNIIFHSKVVAKLNHLNDDVVGCLIE
jgi:hypothetical protein